MNYYWVAAVLVIIGVFAIAILTVILKKIARRIASKKYERSYLCGLCSFGDGLFFSPTKEVFRVRKW